MDPLGMINNVCSKLSLDADWLSGQWQKRLGDDRQMSDAKRQALERRTQELLQCCDMVGAIGYEFFNNGIYHIPAMAHLFFISHNIQLMHCVRSYRKEVTGCVVRRRSEGAGWREFAAMTYTDGSRGNTQS